MYDDMHESSADLRGASFAMLEPSWVLLEGRQLRETFPRLALMFHESATAVASLAAAEMTWPPAVHVRVLNIGVSHTERRPDAEVVVNAPRSTSLFLTVPTDHQACHDVLVPQCSCSTIQPDHGRRTV